MSKKRKMPGHSNPPPPPPHRKIHYGGFTVDEIETIKVDPVMIREGGGRRDQAKDFDPDIKGWVILLAHIALLALSFGLICLMGLIFSLFK